MTVVRIKIIFWAGSYASRSSRNPSRQVALYPGGFGRTTWDAEEAFHELLAGCEKEARENELDVADEILLLHVGHLRTS